MLEDTKSMMSKLLIALIVIRNSAFFGLFNPKTLIFNPFSPPVAADETHIDPLMLFLILKRINALSSTEISEDKELTSADNCSTSKPVTYLSK